MTRMTRKILEEKVATFNSMYQPNPGLTLERGFQCYNVIGIDPITKKRYSSIINKYGLSPWEMAHYLDGLIHAAIFITRNPIILRVE